MPKKPIPKLPYDVPWILQRIRAFLLGREHNTALRWAKDMAPKTQPQPNLPLGASSKIRFNYYCDRDPRGEVKRPQVLYDAELEGQKLQRATRVDSAGCRPLGEGIELMTAIEKTGVPKEESKVAKVGERLERNADNKTKEKEVKETKAEIKEEIYAGKKAEDKDEKVTTNNLGDKEEKDTSKKVGAQDENDTSKTVGVKEEKEASKTIGEEDAKKTSKTGDEQNDKSTKKAGGKKEDETNEKVGESEVKNTIGKAVEKENIVMKDKESEENGLRENVKVGESEVKNTIGKAGEKENIEMKDKESEENGLREKVGDQVNNETINAVKRVPGKVWHWDTIDGEPDKPCCRKEREG